MVGEPSSAGGTGGARSEHPAEASTTQGQAGKPKVPKVPKVPRERLDLLLLRRGIAPSRERARALILAGQVHVDGRVVDKAGTLVSENAAIELAGPSDEGRFVSRGGLKLEYALDAFGLDPAGCVCLDVGASTGGFTDVLLCRGAARVYAVDVGHGQLAWTLRRDPRVVVMERTNIRALDALPEPVDCAVIDVSFISLTLVLPHVAVLVRPGGWVVALVKPQFEAGKAEADRGAGVIADRAVHLRVLRELLAWLARWNEQRPYEQRLVPRGLVASPIAGREGNREYLLELVVGGGAPMEVAEDHGGYLLNGPTGLLPSDAAIEAAVAAAFERSHPGSGPLPSTEGPGHGDGG